MNPSSGNGQMEIILAILVTVARSCSLFLGFDRLPPHLSGAVDPLWAELHHRNMVLPGAPQPPPHPGHMSGIYPGNLTDLGLIQRERERNGGRSRNSFASFFSPCCDFGDFVGCYK